MRKHYYFEVNSPLQTTHPARAEETGRERAGTVETPTEAETQDPPPAHTLNGGNYGTLCGPSFVHDRITTGQDSCDTYAVGVCFKGVFGSDEKQREIRSLETVCLLRNKLWGLVNGWSRI